MNTRWMMGAMGLMAMAWAGCTSEAERSAGELGTEPEPCTERCAEYGSGELVCPCDAVPDVGPPLDPGDPYRQ